MPAAAGQAPPPDAHERRRTTRSVLHRTGVVAGALALLLLTPATLRAQEWHELYADGLKALASGQPARAVDFLRRAIQKRPQPGVNVPTYGTNFEPRYFPYLRIADAYLRLEAFEDALSSLETSARFGIEPAGDRAALETRIRTAQEARRPVVKPVQLAAPAPTPAPPPPPPAESTVQRDPVPATANPPAATTAAPPPPPVASTRPTEPVRRGTPILDLTSDPPGAQVFVDDVPVGRTDPETGRLKLTALGVGRHRVRLAVEGRADVVREFDLGTEPVAFHAVLSPRQAPTVVPVSPNPPPEPASPLGGWPLGLAVVVAIGSSLLLWRTRGSTSRRPATRTPGGGVATPNSGSYEDFPVEFGEYQLLRRVGKGGMATVYEAERRGERVALKRPLAGFLDDPRFLERFVREADLGRALHHPNIVRILDRGQVGQVPYFTMELIDGETLRDRLDRDGRLDPPFATYVAARVAEALDYAHHKGVIHRDLKPGNIMLERSGGVKVMDYGIARAQRLEGVTTTGGFIGTPHYASPEAVGGLTEPRSDLYSLGVVFFEMLTGSLPFQGDNAFALLRAHGFTPPPVPSSVNYVVPEALDRIVLQLLAKEPEGRPNAESLLNQLGDYLEMAR